MFSDAKPLSKSVEFFPEECRDRIETLFALNATSSGIAIGDVHRVLRQVPTGVFQTCVTSPPYWSLRNYGLDGQIGLEPTVLQYLDSLVSAFETKARK